VVGVCEIRSGNRWLGGQANEGEAVSRAYYNEFDPRAAAWLRELMADGLIMTGDVDERSITDVSPDDLRGYVRCHFFAGIGGWDYALQLAGWPEDRPVWTGSCPCPPFSCAGKKKWCPVCEGKDVIPHPLATGVFVCCECEHEWIADERHLWPEFYRLIRECQPPVVFGEQVAGKDGLIWFSGVRATLEDVGYAVAGADLCAAGVGAPHIRQRLYWVADLYSQGLEGRPQQPAWEECEAAERSGDHGHWHNAVSILCGDGKYRRIPSEPLFFPLADGFSGSRVGLLRGAGNAIVPEVAEAFIKAYLER
jgi:DNA (cytosine-5)-methyltransferase 1